MSDFYYWIPIERSTNSAGLLARLRTDGLAYAIDERLTSRASDTGPDARRGVTVCRGGNEDGQLGWWPERQTWKRVPGTELWCGMYTESPPGPDDLRRAEQITGEWVKLDDGNRWLVPMARRWMDVDGELMWAHNLPRRLTLDDNGQWIAGGIKPRYQRLWDLATGYWEAVISGMASEDGSYRFEVDVDAVAIAALQVNYHVGPIELDMLGVFDEQARQRIIDALLDTATWAQWVKKNAPDPAGGSS